MAETTTQRPHSNGSTLVSPTHKDQGQNIQDFGTTSAHPNPDHPSHYNDSNPLAHINSSLSARNAAFAGYLEPGLYAPKKNKFGNPAPLGLSAFALTTFLLSLINFQTRGVVTQNVVVGAAFGYGGLVQLLAGMWWVFGLHFSVTYSMRRRKFR